MIDFRYLPPRTAVIAVQTRQKVKPLCSGVYRLEQINFGVFRRSSRQRKRLHRSQRVVQNQKLPGYRIVRLVAQHLHHEFLGNCVRGDLDAVRNELFCVIGLGRGDWERFECFWS